MRGTALSSVLIAVLALAEPARADDRPTSGDMSLFSGRTLGNGETALAAGLGWPWLWGQITLAPSSTFNLGIRGLVLYGSPIMGLGSGVGGGASLPIRIWIGGTEKLDVSIAIEPGGAAGEGALAGQEATFADDFGWLVFGDAGVLLGMQLSEAVTLTLGALGEVAYVSVPDSSDGDHLVGGALAALGIEALMSRDTMLFADLRAGWGFAPSGLFDGHQILRVSLGLAYLL